MPQPLDLQTELARLTAAERIQQVADRLSLAGVHRHVQDVDQERLAVETQVQHTRQPESEQVEPQGRRRNPFARRKRRRKPDETDEKHAASHQYDGREHDLYVDDTGHRLDVSI